METPPPNYWDGVAVEPSNARFFKPRLNARLQFGGSALKPLPMLSDAGTVRSQTT